MPHPLQASAHPVPSSMLAGLTSALGASLCYGIASVLQAVAAGDAEAAEHLDPRLLLRLSRATPYVWGLALDGTGFVLSLVALRSLPLYVVQAVVASFLAVTAVTAAAFLRTRLRRSERAALAGVVLGLVLVGLSAAPESARPPGGGVEWLLLAAAAALAIVAVPVARLEGRRAAAMLGGVAGLAYGVVAVAARAWSSGTVRGSGVAALRGLARSPSSYALLLAALLAMTTYATALQRGSVVQATAPLVVCETVLPALVGLSVLGDHPRPGWGVAAAAGFALALAGALTLSRYGEGPTREPGGPV